MPYPVTYEIRGFHLSRNYTRPFGRIPPLSEISPPCKAASKKTNEKFQYGNIHIAECKLRPVTGVNKLPQGTNSTFLTLYEIFQSAAEHRWRNHDARRQPAYALGNIHTFQGHFPYYQFL